MFKGKQKFRGKKADESKAANDMEVSLWRKNDPGTYMGTGHMMFRLKLPGLAHIALPIYHAAVPNDHYFDSFRVEQHMRMIYSDFYPGKIRTPTHAYSVVGTAKDAEPYIPKEFIRVMNNIS